VLTGGVVDVLGNPVPGAKVSILPDPIEDAWGERRGPIVKTSTDAFGAFRASGVAEGELGVSVDPPERFGWAQRRRGLRLVDEEIEVVVGSPTEVVGRVVDADTRTPVPSFGIRVDSGFKMCGNAPADQNIAVEDPAGAFRIRRLDPKTNHLTVTAAGYATRWVSTEGLRVEEAQDFFVELHRAATLRGRVIDGDGGARIAAVPICIYDARDSGRYLGVPGTTATDGSFELEGLEPGVGIVEARPDGFFPIRSRTIRLEPGQIVEEIVLRVRRRGGIVGDFVARASSPSTVWIYPRGSTHWALASLDGSGRFRMDGLPAGEYVVIGSEAMSPGGRASDCETRYTMTHVRVREGVRSAVRLSGPGIPWEQVRSSLRER
jgi:hypothetical protein